MLALLGVHAVVGGVALGVGRRLGRWTIALAALPLVATSVWAASRSGDVLDGDAVTSRLEWVPQLGLGVDLRLDGFALLMLVLVSGLGSLVFLYAWHYFGNSAKGPRVAALLVLFAGSMTGVVLADNLLMLYVCWELTSVTSFLLIGVDDTKEESRKAALQALLITGMGGLAMLGGFVLLGQEAGTYSLSGLLADPPVDGSTTPAALVLVLLGAFAKSAQYPFHSWLPGAMVAPTPISAYLHSAAMVKAGVYVIARFAPAFAEVALWRPVVLTVGLVTMIAGGLRALRPYDLKQLLAFGTISQLGFLVVLFGIGTKEATAAACALLLAHGLFKAALFMVVGIVDHEAHTRDLRELPLLRKGWTPVLVVAVLSAASMAAVPLLFGFIAKEKAYDALLNGSTLDRWVLVGIVAGSVLTVAYSTRMVAGLLRPDMAAPATAPRKECDHHPSHGFVAPAAIITVATVVLGIFPALATDLVDRAARALDPDAKAKLKLWHGFNTALLLSAVTLALGAGLFAVRRTVAVLQARLAPPWTAVGGYNRIVSAMTTLAADVTGVVQSGSLPIYSAVVLGTAAGAPLIALGLGDGWWPGWPDLVTTEAQIPIAGLLLVGALAASITRHRFAAALLLGVVGYGMALLFATLGGPDLALTQFAIETLSIIVFLLVLRRLPEGFERRPPAIRRAVRLAVAGVVGLFVTVMAIVSAGARRSDPVSEEMVARALPDGDGRNVVNVILVDIRGLDTLGEITVLAVAAIGITALARAGLEQARSRRTETAPPDRPQAVGTSAGEGA
jgi:multicomponent Na+:H+ antiporter subunit A